MTFFLILSGCKTFKPPDENATKVNSSVPEIIEVLPELSEKPMDRNTELTIRFKIPIDSSTVLVNLDDNRCSGNVQLSSDGFETCVRLLDPIVSSDNKEFKFLPYGIYQPGSQYQFRVTSGIRTLEQKEKVFSRT